LGLAIVSLLVLAIIGALAGLILPRIFGAAAARNEDRPGGGSEEDGNSQGGLGEETRRSVWYFLGVGAAGSAVLVDVVAMAFAFAGSEEFLNSAIPVAFLAFTFAVIGYFLGARKVALGAMAFTVVALAVSAVVLQWV
jgi:hypothetical protein